MNVLFIYKIKKDVDFLLEAGSNCKNYMLIVKCIVIYHANKNRPMQPWKKVRVTKVT